MSLSKIRVVITGVTGMVGEGVLHECLLSSSVEKVLVVTRRPTGITHPKLAEFILKDFFELSTLPAAVSGYDACFFCLGVSSVGMSKETYEMMTYDLTLGFAKTLVKVNPHMIFSYISGAGTDTTQKSKLHWARVKGKTENDLRQLGFLQTYLFRPGMLKPTKGLKNTLELYKWFGWLSPILEIFVPNSICSLAALGKAMIHTTTRGYEKNILEVKDIKIMAQGDD